MALWQRSLGEIHRHQSGGVLIRGSVSAGHEVIAAATHVAAKLFAPGGQGSRDRARRISDLIVVDGESAQDLSL